MRYFEMGSLPTRAGKAVLQYKDVRVPGREEKVITLPKDPLLTEYFPLLGGIQFLLRVLSGDMYFGGTDEEPFLVRLEPGVFNSFTAGGEQGFFEDLKPTGLKDLETKHGSQLTRRQGDIFAYPVVKSGTERPITWHELIDSWWNPDDTVTLGVAESSLFETRHRVAGRFARTDSKSSSTLIFFEGILTAPDHADQDLVGPHRMYQADNLFNPQMAD